MGSESGSVQLVSDAGIARRLEFAATADFAPFKKNSLKTPAGDATDEIMPGENDSSCGRNPPAASPTVRLSSIDK
jgi:hypothetical protein